MQSPASTSGRTRAWKWTAPARRVRLAQCEPSATQSTPPRAVRARRDEIRLHSIRAIPPGAMRAQVTSPKRLPGASVRLPPRGGALRRTGDGWGTPGPRPLGRLGLVRVMGRTVRLPPLPPVIRGLVRVMGRTVRSVLCGQGRAGVDPDRGGRPPPRSRPAGPARGRSRRGRRPARHRRIVWTHEHARRPRPSDIHRRHGRDRPHRRRRRGPPARARRAAAPAAARPLPRPAVGPRRAVRRAGG